MDAYTYIAQRGQTASKAEFLNTIKLLKRSAWNAFPCRHYFGMVTVEQVEGGWSVRVAPTGAGETVNEVFYPESSEETLYLDVGRKMHPTLICSCGSTDCCFGQGCEIRP
jgi:hypothetical protein